jgi:hypothetical protein
MEGSFFQKEFIHSIFSWLRDQYDSRRGVVLSRFRMSVTKTLRKTYINCKLMTKNWKNVWPGTEVTSPFYILCTAKAYCEYRFVTVLVAFWKLHIDGKGHSLERTLWDYFSLQTVFLQDISPLNCMEQQIHRVKSRPVSSSTVKSEVLHHWKQGLVCFGLLLWLFPPVRASSSRNAKVTSTSFINTRKEEHDKG